MKKTIVQQYQGRRKTIEKYCCQGMTRKQMALRLGVDPNKMNNIIKMLDISIMRLRNEGYNANSHDTKASR